MALLLMNSHLDANYKTQVAHADQLETVNCDNIETWKGFEFEMLEKSLISKCFLIYVFNNNKTTWNNSGRGSKKLLLRLSCQGPFRL